MTLLRAWQQQALDCEGFARFQAGQLLNLNVTVTPGGGKTRFGLETARKLLALGLRRLVVVVPNTLLREQWGREAATTAGLQLDWEFANGGHLSPSYHGVVVTYQQVVANPRVFTRLLSEPTLVILDEIHHAGDGLDWGDRLRQAFGPAARRLLLSGTPFRSDNSPIPWVEYQDGVGTSHFTYGYGEAVRDGICRPTWFTPIEGGVTWLVRGHESEATFDMDLPERLAARRLADTLTAEDRKFLRALLGAANQRLQELRERRGWAECPAGLCLANDVEHAQTLSALLHDLTGRAPVVITSDNPEAHFTLANLKRMRPEAQLPWVVAVKMVSEGVDIPRLRVLAYCTRTSTELFFRQACGRIARGPRTEGAHVFLPADPRLLEFARGIEEQRDHVLELEEQEETSEDQSQPGSMGEPRVREGFEVLASRGEVGQTIGTHITHPDATTKDRIAFLRQQCRALVATVVQLEGLGARAYAGVNADLNKALGVPSVEKCTVRQLERRVQLLEGRKAAAVRVLEARRGRAVC